MTQPTPARKPLVSIDFDGVIHRYTSGWKGATVCDDGIVPGLFEFLAGLLGRARVAVYSSRSGEPGGIDAMKGAIDRDLLTWGGTVSNDDYHAAYDAVQRLEWPTSKPPALVTLDDRCVRFTGEWPAVDELLAFKTWQQVPTASEAPAPDQPGPLATAAPPAATPLPSSPSRAALDVLAERERQQLVEEWSPEHDDGHTDKELARAAATFLLAYAEEPERVLHWFWPSAWDWRWLKRPTNRAGYRRMVVKAAALAVAEVERLDRQEETRSKRVTGEMRRLDEEHRRG